MPVLEWQMKTGDWSLTIMNDVCCSFSVISWSFLGPFLVLSWSFLGPFLDISWSFLVISRSFLVKCWKCAYSNIICYHSCTVNIISSHLCTVNIIYFCSCNINIHCSHSILFDLIHKNCSSVPFMFVFNTNEWGISFITNYYCCDHLF